MEGIYILHFDYPFRISSKFQYGDCTHYVGKTSQMYTRMNQHRSGTKGSNKTKLAHKLGIPFTAFAFNVEPSYANETHYTRNVREYCPLCTDFIDATYHHPATLKLNKHSQFLRLIGERSSLGKAADMSPASEDDAW